MGKLLLFLLCVSGRNGSLGDRDLQLFMGYLRLALGFVWSSALVKGLVSVFWELFAGINKVCVLEGGPGAGIWFYGV